MMTDINHTRRRFMAGTSTLAAGLVAAAAPAQAATVCGGLTREQYLDYVDLFNKNDPRFIQYYHDDVEFELANAKVKGAQAIREFYVDVKAHVTETITLAHFISDATGIAAEIPTEFRVVKDWENGYFGRPLKVGMVMRLVSVALYRVRDGKFTNIKSIRMSTIHDWRMEA
jgi:hypothetical protein